MSYFMHRIEIKPRPAMKRYLDMCFGYARYCWNKMLAKRNECLSKHDSKGASLSTISKHMTDNKEDWEYELPNYIKGNEYQNLKSAINRHFTLHLGNPKFKKRGLCKESFTCPLDKLPKKFLKYNDHNTLYVSFGFGRKCKISKDKRFIKMTEEPMLDLSKGDKVKHITFFKEIDRYYATFCIELGGPRCKTTATESVGIDLGLTDLVVTSENKTYNYPRKKLTKLENKTKRYQRLMSSKLKHGSKDSKNYLKTKTKFEKVWRKIRYIRTDCINTIANELVKNFANIFVEDMTMSKKLKNHKLAHAIQNACWGKLVNVIKSTTMQHGAKLIELQPGVDLAPTQTCSKCGHRFVGNNKLTLKDRVYKCPDCGLVLDRDLNAAIVIKQSGLRMLAGTQPSE